MSMKCSDCQRNMVAYLDGELTPQVRLRLARHLEQCPMCYAVYVHERDMARELAYALPLVGQENQPRLEKMWAAIQADMALPRRRPRQHDQMRYGLVGLALILALLLPWTAGQRQVAALAALPTQPSPAATASRTPETGGARALATLYSTVLTPEARPHPLMAPGAPYGTP